jgi:DNA topoisomerase-1
VGYEVSPVLWRAVDKARSAGRVQSVAIRLVCERERERMDFTSATWFDVTATLSAKSATFEATVESLDGASLATGKNFDASGVLDTKAKVQVLSEPSAQSVARGLEDAEVTVRSIASTPRTQRPQPPFMTSSLQIEASRKLRFDPERTMRAAQRLYEQGWITYMRTDSTTLSDEAIRAARATAASMFGDDYVADAPRRYDRKVKNAQEAHEAIRPAGDSFRTPAQAGLSGDERRLYELVWKRTVASQMKDATGESVSVRVTGRSSAGEQADFGASGKVIGFYGFLKAYVEGSDDPDAELDDNQRRLPPLAEADPLTAVSLAPAEHATRSPARYTEASLIKELEDREIGRPSTYASIIGTILDRGYVFK